MQGILGIFRFFQSRMRLIQREFSVYELIMPSRLDFELLSRTFAKIIAERFMNPEKVLQTAKLLGIAEEVSAQMIIYSQMRDALKQIAPKYSAIRDIETSSSKHSSTRLRSSKTRLKKRRRRKMINRFEELLHALGDVFNLTPSHRHSNACSIRLQQ